MARMGFIKKSIFFAVITAMLFAAMPQAYCIEYGEEWKDAPEVSRPYNPYNQNASEGNLSAAPFSDVPETHWAYADILYCRAKKWVDGYSDNTFMPDQTITRAEAITTIDNYLGLRINRAAVSSFSDVKQTAWYTPYIEAGKDMFPFRPELQGSGKIAPEEPITREDMIYILVNALNYDRYLETANYSLLNGYTDSDSVYASIRPYMAVALQYGLIAGYSENTIKPNAQLTRAEFASLLRRTAKLANQI